MAQPSTSTTTLINAILQSQLSATDRGLAYGDGVFETMRVERGVIALWKYHQQRLNKGLQRLVISLDQIKLQQHLLAMLTAIGDQSGVCKLTVTRGEGGRGYMPPVDASPTLIAQFTPNTKEWSLPSLTYIQGVHVHWCEQRLPILPSLAGIKSLNQLSYVLASLERQGLALDEGLLLDTDDHVIEATARNLFIVKDGVIFTPALDQSGVEGVMREFIFNIINAEKLPYPIEIKPLHQQDILDADEVLLTNSVTGIWPVVGCDQREWLIGPITQSLLQCLPELIANEVGLSLATIHSFDEFDQTTGNKT